MPSTQASQLRIAQRVGDAGWISAAATLEREDFFGSDTWSPVDCITKSSVMEINSRAVTYNGFFTRTANYLAVPVRLNLIGNGIETDFVQSAGELTHIKPDGTFYKYQLTYDKGYLYPTNMYKKKYRIGISGDSYQFFATWNIA